MTRGMAVHHFGRRRVLQELAHLVAEHHGAGGEGQVAAHHQVVPVDQTGEAPVGQDVAGNIPHAFHDAPPARLVGALDDVGIEEREVGRRQRRAQQDRSQLGPLFHPPFEVGVIDQIECRARAGEIGLAHAVIERVLLPGPVLEPPVLGLRGDRGLSHSDFRHFDAETGQTARQRIGGRASAHLREGSGEAERINPPEHGTRTEGRPDPLECKPFRHGHHLQLTTNRPLSGDTRRLLASQAHGHLERNRIEAR